MCLSLALVCSEVDGIVVIYLWPPSFAYSKILTRGRYLSRHSRCLRAARVRGIRAARRVDVLSLDTDKSARRQPPRRRGDRDERQPPHAAIDDEGSAKTDTDANRLKYMNSPCLFCTFSTSPESLNQLISSPYSPWAYSSALRQPAHWNR